MRGKDLTSCPRIVSSLLRIEWNLAKARKMDKQLQVESKLFAMVEMVQPH